MPCPLWEAILTAVQFLVTTLVLGPSVTAIRGSPPFVLEIKIIKRPEKYIPQHIGVVGTIQIICASNPKNHRD